MRLILTLLALILSNSVNSATYAKTKADAPICPMQERGETDLDCPWAGVARALEEAQNEGRDLKAELSLQLPKLAKQLDSEAKSSDAPLLLNSWGRSLNYDEYVKDVIVAPQLMDTLLSWFMFPVREERIVHAGVEHTYGYLFSLLKTPFGFKRARWVQDDIETGFGVTRGLLGPAPNQGTFLKNVSVFAQAIAFRNESQPVIQGGAPELENFAYSTLTPTRLLETVLIPKADASGVVTIELRTDFVPFTQTNEIKPNSHLLIYSVKDERVARPQLISLFPVTASFVQTALQADGLGEGKPVITRYNAYVEGLTGSNPSFTGSRKIVTR